MKNKSIKVISLPDKDVANLYTYDDYNIEDAIMYNNTFGENQFVRAEGVRGDAIGNYIYKDNRLKEIDRFVPMMHGGFKPRNLEQKFYFHLLGDNDIPLKVCLGKAGTGKTTLALRFGFEAMNNGLVDKIVIVKEPEGNGKQVGYFKGDKDEKLAIWNSSTRDVLETVSQESLEELIRRHKIELDIPYTMLGRDIKNSWIIVDEAQNLSKKQIKMIGERVSDKSYIVFIGDPSQRVDNKYGDDCGLTALYNAPYNKVLGRIKLTENVRSDVSKFFSDIF